MDWDLSFKIADWLSRKTQPISDLKTQSVKFSNYKMKRFLNVFSGD